MLLRYSYHGAREEQYVSGRVSLGKRDAREPAGADAVLYSAKCCFIGPVADNYRLHVLRHLLLYPLHHIHPYLRPLLRY